MDTNSESSSLIFDFPDFQSRKQGDFDEKDVRVVVCRPVRGHDCCGGHGDIVPRLQRRPCRKDKLESF